MNSINDFIKLSCLWYSRSSRYLPCIGVLLQHLRFLQSANTVFTVGEGFWFGLVFVCLFTIIKSASSASNMIRLTFICGSSQKLFFLGK